MGFTVEKNNFTNIEMLLADLASNLLANGFEIVSLDNQQADLAVGTQHTAATFKAQTAVDPLAGDEDQPWYLHMVANQTDKTLDFYAFTPTQLIIDDQGAVTVATSRTSGSNIYKCGFLNVDSLYAASGDANTHFFSYENWGFDTADEEAVPMSYFLSISDHGIAFSMWAEAYDKDGDKFAWFVIQRMVDDTGAVIQDGKSPLFCVFSQKGGGGTDLNTVDANGILKFVVRESDINTPTLPVSATKDTGDSARIINSVQQTSIYEDGKFIINFPRSLNTQRYSYPHELDMIAYASADVTSQFATHEVTVYGEAQPREYRALNANHADNKGMRIYFQISGIGMDVARA
ncbi:hypothetical protein BN7874_241 [Phage NCTB]|nr:hypothetical protein BN7874_241 [Phage NCTB]